MREKCIIPGHEGSDPRAAPPVRFAERGEGAVSKLVGQLPLVAVLHQSDRGLGEIAFEARVGLEVLRYDRRGRDLDHVLLVDGNSYSQIDAT